MTTENPEGACEPTTETPGNSQPLKSKSDSSSQPKQHTTESHARTVLPREPEHVYHAFEASKPELATIGNEDMIIEMKINGLLGVFYNRDAATRYHTVVYLQCDAYWNSVYNVLKYALTHLLFLRKHVEIDDVDDTTAYAGILADGVMINTYMKLRTVNSLNPLLLFHFRKKPNASPFFEVPLPYALAISQLGQIRASGLPQDLIYTPAMSLDNANRFGLSIQRRWSSSNYGRAVEYATKLGMRFSYADHSVKLGSTWWLLRTSETEGRFTFECPLPEENFTTNMALLATLFCLNDVDEPYNPIFNLEPLGTNNFGTMLRDPHDLIAVSTFFAVEVDPSVVWTTELLKGLEATLGSPFSSDPLAPPANPVIIVISGPSGVGKDAVIKRLQEVRDGIHFVVTATSRARRPGEIDGKDYHFVSKEEFLSMIERNELLEYALVYGEYKGIPKQQIRDFMAKGYDIVLRVDVQGAATLRSVLGSSAIFVFLVAESEEVLARRLVDRKTETSDMLLVRIATAREEVKCMRDFDYVVVNAEGKLDAAVKLVESIIDAEKARVKQRSVRL